MAVFEEMDEKLLDDIKMGTRRALSKNNPNYTEKERLRQEQFHKKWSEVWNKANKE